MKKTIISTAIGIGAALLLSMSAFAASNPAGTGQPGADCADEVTLPTGFGTDGFAYAETVYAGSDGTPSSDNAQSSAAVSQYDVACYQVSQPH